MARSKMMKNPWSMAACQAAVPTEASVTVDSTVPSIRNCIVSALVFVRSTTALPLNIGPIASGYSVSATSCQ